MQKKAQLQAMLFTYEERRADYKTRGLSTKNVTKKIKAWKRSLRILEKREEKVLDLLSKVQEFTDINIRGASGKQNTATTLAKYLYYKTGLESGLKGPWLQRYTGDTHSTTCYIARQVFTKSLLTKPSNMDVWRKWKQFLNLYDDTNTGQTPLPDIKLSN